MCIEKRRAGWLDPHHHGALRETLIHLCARHQLLCPAYCLMPDHGHFLLMGLADRSDQLLGLRFMRKDWNRLLRPSGYELQKQAYDHVLNESERNQTEFEDTLIYVLKNPQRGKIVEHWDEWPFLGAIAAGYPDFDPRMDLVRFLQSMWKIHNRERTKLRGEAS